VRGDFLRDWEFQGDLQLSTRVMSTKYQTGHQVPAEFPRILKEFVREILRYQPKNIYQFGAEYFEDKLQGGAKLSPLQMSHEQLVKYFHNIFLSADTDGSGQLDKKEFKKLMKSSEMDLPKKAVKALYSEVICFYFCSSGLLFLSLTLPLADGCRPLWLHRL
jgi:hypothetical protein